MVTHRISSNPIVVRPTLVVGLGGTGVLICRHAWDATRKLLGEILPFLKFVGLDTDEQEEAKVPKLDATDFYNLFNTPYLQLAEVLRGFDANPDFYPHLQWLRGMKLDSAYVGHGCQGLSRLGRVVLFQVLNSVIRPDVVARYEALNSTTLADQTAAFPPKDQFALARIKDPVIHIAASVCGGTGSGMLLDMAYCLRRWANDVFGRTADIVAHLMLPEAFSIRSDRIKDKLRAVAATTLEQIELLTDRRRANFTVRYRNGVVRTLAKTMAPFDFCHLLSGVGPMGGDLRRELSAMMGRMIRAMTVEPSSQHIYSDANNKQLDILSQYEENNGRRLFLSSYGLHGGTPGFPSQAKLVRFWLSTTLGAADGRVQSPTAWDAPIDRTINESFDLARLARELPRPKGFRMKGQPGQGTLHELAQGILDEVDHHLDEQVPARLGLARQLLAGTARSAILDEARQMVEETRRDHASMPALVHACIVRWRERLKTAQDKRHADTGLSPRQVAADIKRQVRRDLKGKGQEPGRLTPPTPVEVEEVANGVLDQQHGRLDAACLRQEAEPALQQLGDSFWSWLQGLESLALAAQNEGAKLVADPDLNPVSDDPLSTPLAELVHPDQAEGDAAKAVIVRFYQQLVAPILAAFLTPFGRDDEPFGPGDSRAAIVKASEFLESCLQSREADMEGFLAAYSARLTDEFHKPVDSERAAANSFVRSVDKVVDGAFAKVAVNQADLYTETLDEMISQHGGTTCVPGLLKRKVGGAYREAPVTQGYEEQTNLWVQLIQIRYGFCVEALNQWQDYQMARQLYLERARFETSDLWLDPAWEKAHQDLLERCRGGTAASRDGPASKAAAGRPPAAADGRDAEMIQRLEQAVGLFVGETQGEIKASAKLDRTRGFDLYEMVHDFERWVNRILAKLRDGSTPDVERRELRDGLLGRARELIAELSGLDLECGDRLLEVIQEAEEWYARENPAPAAGDRRGIQGATP